MSFRDPHAMLECLFYVNELPGGEAHHDGGMKGRDHAAALANPMLQLTADEQSAPRSPAAAAASGPSCRRRARQRDRRTWCCRPRMSPAIALPGTDKPVTARAGSEAAYVAVAKKYPDAVLLRVVRSQSVDEARQGRRAACRPATRSR